MLRLRMLQFEVMIWASIYPWRDAILPTACNRDSTTNLSQKVLPRLQYTRPIMKISQFSSGSGARWGLCYFAAGLSSVSPKEETNKKNKRRRKEALKILKIPKRMSYSMRIWSRPTQIKSYPDLTIHPRDPKNLQWAARHPKCRELMIICLKK